MIVREYFFEILDLRLIRILSQIVIRSITLMLYGAVDLILLYLEVFFRSSFAKLRDFT